MFRFVPSPEFSWPVDIHVPVDGGEKAVQRFTARLRPDAALQQQFAERRIGEADFARAVVVGWDGVGDEAGDPLPFTAENLRRLVAIPYVRRAIVWAYLQAVDGRALAGNSAAPPGAMH